MQIIEPQIIVDTREQNPLVFQHYRAERGTLTSGDYSMRGFENQFAIERKSIPDLIGSLTHDRERFTRELERLRGYTFKRLLIEGTFEDIEQGRYRSKATPAAIIGSLYALEIRFNIPVVFADTRERAARMIESWSYYFVREQITRSEKILAVIETSAQTAHSEPGAAAAATTPGRPSDAAGAIVAPITATTATQSGKATRNKGVKVLLKGALGKIP